MIELFVPGRLCLFGEHTDWAGRYRTMNADIEPGMAIVTGIEQGIYAEIEKSMIFEMTCEAEGLGTLWNDFSCRMTDSELKSVAKSGSFFSYCAGVASYMLEWYKVGGLRINIKKMTLPIKSGLSSSAAICVLVARAFNILYHLNLNTMGEMNSAYLGELRTQSRCGRLDQVCAFGVRPNVMVFDGDEISVKPMSVKVPLHYVFADLCSHKDTITILRDLNKAYPFASNEKEQAEHDFLGKDNLKMIDQAVRYMAEGKVKELGQLMTYYEEQFDICMNPISEALKAPVLKRVLSDENIKPLVYGGKGVGSHGDGSVQFLAKGQEEQDKLADYLNSIGCNAHKLTISPAHIVRKAIIPVAGFGTRLYPATKGVRKEFFPIPCPDGTVKPVILILIEELVKSGIEEICIVLGNKQERQAYADYFERMLPDEHLSKLTKNNRNFEKHILSMGKKLTYVYQTEKRGFGHAVYQAADFAGEEPVLLMLGDTIYKSMSNKPCALQMIEAFEKYNKLMVGIHPIPVDEVSRYGVMSGVWEDRDFMVMKVETIKEKPSRSFAEDYLGVGDQNGIGYYSVFGQYVLTHEVFAQLADDIKAADQCGSTAEIELTAALEKVRQRHGMIGYKVKGQMFDMGNPVSLRNTIIGYSE